MHKVDVEHNSKLEEILNKHSNLLEPGLGRITEMTAKLYLKKEAQPKFCKACQIPYAICEKVSSEIDRQVEEGILEPVKFSRWATPVVPVMKKDGLYLFVCAEITRSQSTK